MTMKKYWVCKLLWCALGVECDAVSTLCPIAAHGMQWLDGLQYNAPIAEWDPPVDDCFVQCSPALCVSNCSVYTTCHAPESDSLTAPLSRWVGDGRDNALIAVDYFDDDHKAALAAVGMVDKMAKAHRRTSLPLL